MSYAQSTVDQRGAADRHDPDPVGRGLDRTGYTSQHHQLRLDVHLLGVGLWHGQRAVDSSGPRDRDRAVERPSSTVTITATRTGYTTTSAQTSGSALLTGTGVDLSSPISTSTGYVFTITNYDTNYTYTVDAPGATAVDSIRRRVPSPA